MVPDGSVLLRVPGDVRVEQAVGKASPSMSSYSWQVQVVHWRVLMGARRRMMELCQRREEGGCMWLAWDCGMELERLVLGLCCHIIGVGPINAIGDHGCFRFTSSASFASRSWAPVTSASSSGSVTFISSRHDDTAKRRGWCRSTLRKNENDRPQFNDNASHSNQLNQCILVNQGSHS